MIQNHQFDFQCLNRFRKCLALAVFGLSISIAGCSQGSSGTASVTIPSVYVNCTTSHCKVNASPNPLIQVIFTTSGCTNPDFGSVASATTFQISCSSALGCYGQVTGWVNSSGATVTSLTSGYYSICARVDYNRDYPATTNGDSVGSITNVSVSNSAVNQYVTTWTDL